MKSIFNQTDNQEIISRIQALSPESKALWGKMSVDQMLSHCIAPIDIAFGNSNLKANFLMQILGKMVKAKMLKQDVFKKNSPTAPSFIRTGNYDFETTKNELIRKIQQFEKEGHAVIKNTKHPFFGTMTHEEWDRLQFMHLNHHLQQFGV